ncbi:hypothetical protein D9615_000907 [Tricholomella constricta]|uniref:Uncharacterized protein n=1 Tax=Tricholomella constricta TaxID=117010 RepID=A0A8H5HKM4_9AGAR|nr:hypothetical protein D9615_000907 [Tricholomella constricta]
MIDALGRLVERRKQRKRRRLEAQQPSGLDFNQTEPSAAADFAPDGGEKDFQVPQDVDISMEIPLSDSELPQEPIPTNAAGRPIRVRRRTWKILELLPDPPAPIPLAPAQLPLPDDDDKTPPPTIQEYIWNPVRSILNTFGLFREYAAIPTHNPDDRASLNDLSYIQSETTGDPNPGIYHLAPISTSTGDSSYAPFRNSSIFGLMNWMWSGSALKSLGDMGELVNFLKSDDFRKEDLEGFNIRTETAHFDEMLEADVGEGSSAARDGWKEVGVKIQIPDGQHHTLPEDIPTYEVPGLHFRKLTEILKSVISDSSAYCFHYMPFKQYWQPTPDREPERVYDEIFSSDAFIAEHIKVQQQPPEPGCQLERVVAALMFWSDSTHLASFGNASLWPLYLYFGNQSKWLRGKPRAGACHHVAYIPKLPDEFNDFFEGLVGNAPSADILTHCRRDLMHAVWQLILDDDFLYAYEHGIVIECPDGIFRRFYPRILTYSADYPEKVVLATIRNLGACPCPRCLLQKEMIPEVGTKLDATRRETLSRTSDTTFREKVQLARDAIYRLAVTIKSVVVERLLAAQSLVPTTNAFTKLSKFGFNLFTMFVPDFMHEFELGVWKQTFVHLMRILVAHGGAAIQHLNQRYRMVPVFGRSTIRRFSDNASAMKKLAARNYEDLLQCAMPVFEGLLDEPHNSQVLDLLFTLAEWHSLAKLRLHTDSTIQLLDQCTTDLGRQLRKFTRNVCSAFDTRELPREVASRGRQKAKKKKTTLAATADEPAAKMPPKKKSFNMFTYKIHALGDYTRTIKWFGTTDSYSTQPGELEHRRVKKFYARTNKNQAVRQMTKLEQRERALRMQRQALKKGKAPENRNNGRKGLIANPRIDFSASEALPHTPPEVHHHISPSRNFHLDIPTWLAGNAGDPAIIDFLPKLKDHLLARLAHPEWTGDGNEFTPAEHSNLLIRNNRLYIHKVFRVNYTTYDVRRGQDSMNPRTRADIMTLSHQDDTDHPFAYARILGVFHADVTHNVPGNSRVPVSIEFLWVRWYRRDPTYRAGFKRKRLHRLEFLPDSDPDAYGFLNPDEVIRGSHIIPAFYYGPTETFAPSLARAADELDDWVYYYVNIFVDRDMYMRYAGGGVGHYRVALPEDASNPGMDEDVDTPTLIQPLTSEPGALEEEEGSSGSDSDEASSSEEDVDLGPEDGEGGLDEDEDNEGYAAL